MPRRGTIAHAVIGLIHGLGCEAVAEGIETQAQADVLRVIGCDVIQGYAIARADGRGRLYRLVAARGPATGGRIAGRVDQEGKGRLPGGRRPFFVQSGSLRS